MGGCQAVLASAARERERGGRGGGREGGRGGGEEGERVRGGGGGAGGGGGGWGGVRTLIRGTDRTTSKIKCKYF